MRFSSFVLNKPILILVLNIVIIFFGLISIGKMTVQKYPNSVLPEIYITTEYSGANAEIIERDVTQVIEQAMSGVEGIKNISSKTTYGKSNIEIIFALDTNLDLMANNIQDKLAAIKYKLPEEAEKSIVTKFTNQEEPLLYLVAYGKDILLEDIYHYCAKTIKNDLSKIDGIATVEVSNNHQKNVIISPKLSKMMALGITYDDIKKQVKKSLTILPLGKIISQRQEFILTIKNNFNQLDDINRIVIKSENNIVVFLEDVADISLVAENSMVERYNTQNSVSIWVYPKFNANTLRISQDIKNYLSAYKKDWPKNFEISVVNDDSVYIKKSLETIIYTICEATVLVSIITYLFLGNIKLTIIPILAIPISIIGGAVLMYLSGFSINLLTLLAVVLAIGLVVDDAIIILENIHYNYKKSTSTKQAAQEGTDEIIFAVIAITLSLITVFIPLSMIGGNFKSLFSEFALSIAFFITFSLITAFTLTPILADKILSKSLIKSDISISFNKYFQTLTDHYIKSLSNILHSPKNTIITTVVIILISVFALKNLPIEITPKEDKGFIYAMLKGGKNDTIEKTAETIQIVEKSILQHPDIENIYVNAGSNSNYQGFLYIELKDKKARQFSILQIVKDLNMKLSKIPNILAYVMMPSGIRENKKEESEIKFYLLSNMPYFQLNNYADKLTDEMRRMKIFSDIDKNFNYNKKTIELSIDPIKAAILGIDYAKVQELLNNIYIKKKLGIYQGNSRAYDIYMQLKDKDKATVTDLMNMQILNDEKKYIPIENIIIAKEKLMASSYGHHDKRRAIVISANLLDNIHLNDVKNIILKITDKMFDKLEIQVKFGGIIEDISENNINNIIVFILALFFIYLVLVVQFNNFTDPLLIISSMPFAVSGGVIMLLLCGSSINIYSQMGITILLGLITKNAVLIIEYMNKILSTNIVSVEEALKEAAKRRFRPIMMTTSIAVIGVFPLIFSNNFESEARKSIGVVIAGGLIFSAIFTLYILPIILIFVKRKKLMVRNYTK